MQRFVIEAETELSDIVMAFERSNIPFNRISLVRDSKTLCECVKKKHGDVMVFH